MGVYIREIIINVQKIIFLNPLKIIYLIESLLIKI